MSQNSLFADAFAEALQTAATAYTGQPWQLHLAPSSKDDTSNPAATAIALRLRGQIEGELLLSPDDDASRRAFPSVDPSTPGSASKAWLDLCEGTADQIAQSLAATFGDVQLEDCRLAQLSAKGLQRLADVVLDAEQTSSGRITLLADTALQASLTNLAENTGAAASDALARGYPEVPAAATLQRVIDVPLAVTLRFGQRQLTLRELLDLNTGSLLELDRQVEEPVDLILDNRVIARGEVVIVDGNYGMRVTEVVESPVRRLAAPV